MNFKKKHFIIAAIALAIIAFLLWPSDQQEKLYSKVKKGDIKIEVNTSGELKAKKSESIKGPLALRNQGIWRIKITDIVPEGTYVKENEYVAQLDKSEVGTKIIDASIEVDKLMASYEQTRLDTIIEMTKLRNELENTKYEIEEKQLVFNQSTYEAPTVKRQAEIDLERINRNYKQSLENYEIKQKQNSAKIYQAKILLQQQQNKLNKLEELMQELRILAPKDGMVVYKRTWDGNKITTGSQISVWDPTVATLPELTKMITKTYVNEIDISKVKVGLDVSISIDAFPDKAYTGKVKEVANVGEQLLNDDAKVFEVIIELNEKDTLLRPAMTTNNQILIEELRDVLFIPQECVFSNDTIDYAVVRTTIGLRKQKLDIGKSNNNFVVVSSGLSIGEEVLMNKPEDLESISWR